MKDNRIPFHALDQHFCTWQKINIFLGFLFIHFFCIQVPPIKFWRTDERLKPFLSKTSLSWNNTAWHQTSFFNPTCAIVFLILSPVGIWIAVKSLNMKTVLRLTSKMFFPQLRRKMSCSTFHVQLLQLLRSRFWERPIFFLFLIWCCDWTPGCWKIRSVGK